MVEPKDIQIIKRERFFVPDEVRILVFVCSQFGVFHERPEALAEEYWAFLKNNEIRSFTLLCRREKRTSQAIKEGEESIQLKYDHAKDELIESFKSQFASYKLLGGLPATIVDGKSMLLEAYRSFGAKPANILVMTSEAEYLEVRKGAFGG